MVKGSWGQTGVRAGGVGFDDRLHIARALAGEGVTSASWLSSRWPGARRWGSAAVSLAKLLG